MTPPVFTDGPIPHGYVAPVTARDLNAIYERELHADIVWARQQRRMREPNLALACDIIIVGCLAVAMVCAFFLVAV